MSIEVANVLNDAANCNLAGMNWVSPDGDMVGPCGVRATMVVAGCSDLSASEIDASQTFWENTAIVIASDDWAGCPIMRSALSRGGRALQPPARRDYPLGFRVLWIEVSAYTQWFTSIQRQLQLRRHSPDDRRSRRHTGINGISEGTPGVADACSTTDRHVSKVHHRADTPFRATERGSARRLGIMTANPLKTGSR
jgi:hypothetical protein